MRIKSYQQGFSLPEIMIALGLLGGISIVTIRLIENQANNEAHLKAKAEIQKATALLKTILNNPESCRNMLKEQIIPTSMASSPTSIGLPPPLPFPSSNPVLPAGAGLYQRIKLPVVPLTYAYKEILAANARYGLFRTGAIQFAKTSDNNSPTRILTPVPMMIDVDSVDLILQFRLESKSILNAFRSDGNDANDKTFIQRVPMLVTFDTTDPVIKRIKDCGLVTSEASVAAKEKFCDGLGTNMAVWDAPSQRCIFRESTCAADEIPKRQNKTSTSPQLFTCVKIRADEIFDTSASCTIGAGGFTVGPNATTGKLEIKCN